MKTRAAVAFEAKKPQEIVALGHERPVLSARLTASWPA